MYRPSVPQVIIKPNFIGRKLNLVVQQIQDTLYQFPLEIEFLKKDNTSETIKVLVKKREQYIVVPSINAFEPIQGMIDGFNINLKRTSAINVDPKSKLLLDWKMVFPK